MKKILLVWVLLLALYAPFLKAQSFPPYSFTVFDTTVTGYYLTCLLPFGSGAPYGATHMVLDRYGRLVYYKPFAGNTYSGDFKLQPDGRVSYTSGNKFLLLDSTFTVTDSVALKNGIVYDEHDFQVLPNGEFLMLGLETVTMDLSAYPWFNHNGSAGSSNAQVKCGVIQIQDSDKNVVFEWHCRDYFNFADVNELYLNSPVNVDWNHLNAVALDNDGNLLLSVRHFDGITKINRSTGAVMWRLGGKNNAFTFTDDPAPFRAQHDVRRIANGNITVYDNGHPELPLHPATAKEYQVDENGLTAKLVWSYINDSGAWSLALGNVQRASNGNTIVNYGLMSRGNTVFTLLSPLNGKLSELSFPDTLRAYRSFYYPSLPWPIQRPGIGCYRNNGQMYLLADSGYSNYVWSTGSLTQATAVNAGDTAFVLVPAGSGGWMASEYVVVTGNEACQLLSAPEIPETEVFTMFPNPSGNEVMLVWRKTAEAVNIRITDINGRDVYHARVTNTNRQVVSLKALAPGMYQVRINGKSATLVKQ